MTQPARPVESDGRRVRPLLDGDLPGRHHLELEPSIWKDYPDSLS